VKPRQEAILRALGHAPELTPEPPRDQAGRFTAEKPSAGFDGGARQPVRLPSDPVADHNAIVAELLRARHVQRSSGAWTVAE
jgi:hypothetical protein